MGDAETWRSNDRNTMIGKLLIKKPEGFGETLYKLLPLRYRMNDTLMYRPVSKDRELPYMLRFLMVFGDLYDKLVSSIADISKYHFVDTCPDRALAHLAANYGLSLSNKIDIDTARLLIDRMLQLYPYSGTEWLIKFFAQTVAGVSVVVHSNPGKVLPPKLETVLTEEYIDGEFEITVDDSGGFEVDYPVTVYDQDKYDTAHVVDVDGFVITLDRPLSYSFASGVDVVSRRYSDIDAVAGITGWIGLYSDEGFSDTLPSDPSLSLDDAEDMYKIEIEWHHFPSLGNFNVILELMQAFIPLRYEVSHVNSGYSGFISDISESDGNERSDG